MEKIYKIRIIIIIFALVPKYYSKMHFIVDNTTNPQTTHASTQ